MGTTYNMTNQDSPMCIDCQWCCHHLVLQLDGIDTELLEARGHKCLRREYFDEVMIETTCPHLTDSGCDIYEARPLACILFPWESHPLIKDHCELMRRNYPSREDISSTDYSE